jgi:hypothetical protein
MAAGLSVDLDRWRDEFDELMLRVAAGGASVVGLQARGAAGCSRIQPNASRLLLAIR